MKLPDAIPFIVGLLLGFIVGLTIVPQRVITIRVPVNGVEVTNMYFSYGNVTLEDRGFHVQAEGWRGLTTIESEYKEGER